VQKADDVIGPEVEKLVSALPNGGVLLLENVRFYKEEEKNEPEFAQKLASLADLYVNDAFGTAHRAHASTEGVTKFLKPSVAGFLLQKVIFLFLCLHVPFCNSETMKDGIKEKKCYIKQKIVIIFSFSSISI
jgi:3-phosphoglycerate kinase